MAVAPVARPGAALSARRRPPAAAAARRGAAAAAAAAEAPAPPSRVRRLFDEVAAREAAGAEAGGAGGGTSWAAFQRAEAAWAALRRPLRPLGPKPEFVRTTRDPLPPGLPLYDVAVCGGTLGVFLAAALAARGLRVAVVERGPLAGRAQEWNVSRRELAELVAAGALGAADAEAAVAVEFNPVRVAFDLSAAAPDGGQAGGGPSPPKGRHPFSLHTRDVLNLGVSPARLVAAARARLEAAGGAVLERAPLEGVSVHPGGAALRLAGGRGLAARLVLDAMGNGSPMVAQARWGTPPDGVCAVVGGCAAGPWPDNATGDVIATLGPSLPPAGAGGALGNLQTFWEAFPAGSAPGERTTYMFAYMDAAPARPTLEALFEQYLADLPAYQRLPGGGLGGVAFRRLLFGVFPTYRASPLAPAWDRVLPVGDASGVQSPLSFGGFGGLCRHAGRLAAAVADALGAGALDRWSLATINAYNPGLSAAWMLQRAMSVPAPPAAPGGAAAAYDPGFINRLLAGNFAAMAAAGNSLRPFLQDVLQAGPLARTLAAQVAADPLFVPAIVARVGAGPLADWAAHYAALCLYTALARAARRWGWEEKASRLPPRQRFLVRRGLDAWKFGSGLDYEG